MTENLTMPASEAIGKGLTVYQIVVALGAGLALLAGVWILLFPISSQNIGSLGSGNVSLIKFGSIAVGLTSAGIGTVFFFFLRSLKVWFAGIASWTYGDDINSVTLDDVSSSIRRWLTLGKWLPAIYIGSVVVCFSLWQMYPVMLLVGMVILFVGMFLVPPFGMIAFTSLSLSLKGTTQILASSALMGTLDQIKSVDEVKTALWTAVIFFAAINIALVVANWVALNRVETWVGKVTRQFTRRARGRTELLGLDKTLGVWFVASQVLQGALVLLCGYLLIFQDLLRVLLYILSSNFVAGLYFVYLIIGPLVVYVTTFLLLQWTRPFMNGVSYYIDTFLSGQQSA